MNKSCYDCQHSRICAARSDLNEAVTKNMRFFNIDSAQLHGKFTDIFTAAAKACFEYKPIKRETDEK